MPIAKPKKNHPDAPVCKACNEEMVLILTVPVPNAPGFEDVFYECPACNAEVKITAIPM